MYRILAPLVIICAFISCTKEDNDHSTPDPDPSDMYFPPLHSAEWDTVTPLSLGWNEPALDDLKTFLEDHGTRAFLVLKDGRLVVEEYWGDKISTLGSFDRHSQWYWASAGKTLTAFLVGRAQEDGLLDIYDRTSDYLGEGWTSLTQDQEEKILIRHQLTMTTGLDYETESLDCTDPVCLQYKADPGKQWFYHNAPYTLLESVVSEAAGISYNGYTDQTIETEIGMDGSWIKLGDNNVYWSTARDVARFGHLLLNKGQWDGKSVLGDEAFLEEMTQSSQDINPSYGYLTWLNGKGSVVLPGSTWSFNFSMAPDAPDDLYAAMGKNGQFIDVVPSENLVVVRMGEAPDNALVPAQFHNEMWKKLGEVRMVY